MKNSLILFLTLILQFSLNTSHAQTQGKEIDPLEIICDNFNLSSSQEGDQTFEKRVENHFKKCEQFYLEKYNKNSEVLVAKLEQLKLAKNQLLEAYSEVLQLTNTADYNCNEDMLYTSRTAEFSENLRAIVTKVAKNTDFTSARPTAKNAFPQIGQLVMNHDDGTPGVKCNTTYIEYPSGRRGFVTNAHCLYLNKRLRNELEKFSIYMGDDSENPINRNNPFKIKSIECGTNDTKDSNNPFLYRDECLITITETIQNLEPIKRVFLSDQEIKNLPYKNGSIYLVGFHPSRINKYIKNNINFPAWSTKTIQKCMLERWSINFDNKPGRFIFHSCAMDNHSSGAPLIYVDSSTHEKIYIGTSKGAGKQDANFNSFAVNVFEDELNIKAFSN